LVEVQEKTNQKVGRNAANIDLEEEKNNQIEDCE